MADNNRHYIFNLETTKIELHFEKSEYNAMTDEQKRELKVSAPVIKCRKVAIKRCMFVAVGNDIWYTFFCLC